MTGVAQLSHRSRALGMPCSQRPPVVRRAVSRRGMAKGRSGLGRARVVNPTSGLRGPRLRRRPGPVAVVGPALIAGLSDDDPAGITTYSVLGAGHGYQFVGVDRPRHPRLHRPRNHRRQ